MSLEIAIQVATSAHLGQKDKLGQPYILHPLAVMLSLSADKVEHLEDARIVAVLHDVVEDTKITLDDLRVLKFSSAVVEAVDAITHRKGETNKDYWARCKANPIARRVKIADMRHNISPARLENLDEPTANRLRDKYARGLAFMLADEGAKVRYVSEAELSAMDCPFPSEPGS